jgi:isopentenyl phosphate kinase
MPKSPLNTRPNPFISHSDVVFLKLGGSLITDKSHAYTARPGIIRRLADNVHQALNALPGLRLLIGHGSGSFGHWAAKPHGTRQGVRTPAQWRGYAEVAAAAAHLNRIVTDTFLKAGVPVLSIQPSATARCHDYALTYLDTRPIHAALAQELVPLVYGDVALDDAHGGTIISTEDIFLYLVDELHPAHILLLGEVDGVLDAEGNVVPRITPDDLPALQKALAGSAGVDVTGGMVDKVMRMSQIVQHHPQTSVHILPGAPPELLMQVLLGTGPRVGTLITAD